MSDYHHAKQRKKKKKTELPEVFRITVFLITGFITKTLEDTCWKAN